MERRLALALFAILVGGCQNQPAPVFDPFLGRTTVPPPGTMQPQGSPYYLQPPNVIVPNTNAQGSSAPAAAPLVVAQDAWGRSLDTPTARRLANMEAPQATMSFATTGAAPAPIIDLDAQYPGRSDPFVVAPIPDRGVVQAGWQSPTPAAAPSPAVRIIEPAGQPAASFPANRSLAPRNSSAEPLRFIASTSANDSDIRDISDLPEAGSSAASRSTSTIAGNTWSSSGVASSSSASGATSGQYGHDPSYSWLKGKLEFSQSTRRWKLRYIPLDGATDDFGGSVILPENAGLDGFEPGEFVTLYGALARGQAAGFSPLYQPTRVSRQGTAIARSSGSFSSNTSQPWR